MADHRPGSTTTTAGSSSSTSSPIDIPEREKAYTDTIVPTLASLAVSERDPVPAVALFALDSSSNSSNHTNDFVNGNSNGSGDPSSSSSPPSSSSSMTLQQPTPNPALAMAFPANSISNPSPALVAAIKSRDFVNTPAPSSSPVRPSPTTLSRPLPVAAPSTSSNPTAPGGSSASTSGTLPIPPQIQGMASAPVVQTLSSNSTLTSTRTRPGGVSPMPGAASTTAVPSIPISASGAGSSLRSGFAKSGSNAGLAARIPPSLQAKMAAMASRSNNPTSVSTHLAPSERIPTSTLFGGKSPNPLPSSSASSSSSSSPIPIGRPSAGPGIGPAGRVGSTGPVAGRGAGAGASGLGKRRGPGAGLSLAGMGASIAPPSSSSSPPGLNGQTNGKGPPIAPPNSNNNNQTQQGGTPFSNFSKIVDPSGSLNFQNKAVLHAKGVDFSNGSSFNINMGELELQDELGSGNYGTVQKVYHKVTKVTMAMKEIRLELDDSKLKAIITELDILHRATAPEIIEFYGAFFIEGCVYYCMEFMDARSLDHLAGAPLTEPVLKRVTASMVRGLKFLKDELQTMHRDVKPTNVLVNTAGAIKLCDFGVSGQLERSLAKTNIGCQSYMAPERIKGESLNFLGTYTVSSDVWSLGLSIVEFAVGHYPYPPETYSNVFAQLQAIVHGDPPSLPNGYSRQADDFVARCLRKDANKRPSYGQLLEHPFLKDEPTLDIDMVGWVKSALEFKARERAKKEEAMIPPGASNP